MESWNFREQNAIASSCHSPQRTYSGYSCQIRKRVTQAIQLHSQEILSIIGLSVRGAHPTSIWILLWRIPAVSKSPDFRWQNVDFWQQGGQLIGLRWRDIWIWAWKRWKMWGSFRRDKRWRSAKIGMPDGEKMILIGNNVVYYQMMKSLSFDKFCLSRRALITVDSILWLSWKPLESWGIPMPKLTLFCLTRWPRLPMTTDSLSDSLKSLESAWDLTSSTYDIVLRKSLLLWWRLTLFLFDSSLIIDLWTFRSTGTELKIDPLPLALANLAPSYPVWGDSGVSICMESIKSIECSSSISSWDNSFC